MDDKNFRTKSQLAHENGEPDACTALTDADVDALLKFFQLLDEWDREHATKQSAVRANAQGAARQRDGGRVARRVIRQSLRLSPCEAESASRTRRD